VSREIHDDLCQRLAAAVFDVGVLAAEPLTDATRAGLRELETRLANLSTIARNLAYQLHPSILGDLGLAPSLKALCDEVGQRNGMVVKFTNRQAPGLLSLEVMTCVYRIAQEALRNAIKHSGAKHVTVTLATNTKDIRIAIQDDGVGFDPRSNKGKGGLGLVSMEERIRLVAGKLWIKSNPGLGTSIIASAPFKTTS